MVMVVPAELPIKSVAEFITLARANPGSVSLASSGSGALPRLTTEKFRLAAKLEMPHVPYKGSGAVLVDLLAGRTQMMMDIIFSARPMAQSGKLRAPAVITAKRDAALPAVPTMIEAGLLRHGGHAGFHDCSRRCRPRSRPSAPRHRHVACVAGDKCMTDDEKQQIAQLVMDAQGLTISAVSQAMAVVVARLAWHVHAHEKLRADLKEFLRDFAPDKPGDPGNELMHSMIEAVLRKILLRLSEIPDLENPPNE